MPNAWTDGAEISRKSTAKLHRTETVYCTAKDQSNGVGSRYLMVPGEQGSFRIPWRNGMRRVALFSDGVRQAFVVAEGFDRLAVFHFDAFAH
jgi:hypothetical protein